MYFTAIEWFADTGVFGIYTLVIEIILPWKVIFQIKPRILEGINFLKIVVHLVFQTYLEQNFEHLCQTIKFKNIFTTRKLKLVAKLESETYFLKKYTKYFS